MSVENPTAETSGASIEERLERLITAEPQATETPEVQAPEVEAVKTEVPENGEPAEKEQPQLSTSELAKIFGVEESSFDVDESGQPVIKTKIDGKEGAAKLADLVKSYQLQGHAENKARQVAEQEKALQTRAQEADQALRARVEQVEQLANIAGAELLREYQSIDWNSLRHTDPGQYAALQQDFQGRKAQLQGVFQNTSQQRAQQAQQWEANKADYLKAEAEKLPTFIPEWKDRSVAEKESADIVKWAKEVGFTHEQLKGINESSALHLATVRKAMLYDTLQQSKASVENRVRQAPKIVKPGTAAVDTKAERLQGLKQTVSKTGGKNGSLEALLIARGLV